MAQQLTIVFDWEAGQMTVNDDTGMLQTEPLQGTIAVLRSVLISQAAARQIATAEQGVADAQQKLAQLKAREGGVAWTRATA